MRDLLSETDVTWLVPLNFEPRRLFPAGLVIDDLHAELIEIDENSCALGANAGRRVRLYLEANVIWEERGEALITRLQRKREKHR